MPGSPAQFGKLIAEETEKWGNRLGKIDIRQDRQTAQSGDYLVQDFEPTAHKIEPLVRRPRF